MRRPTPPMTAFDPERTDVLHDRPIPPRGGLPPGGAPRPPGAYPGEAGIGAHHPPQHTPAARPGRRKVMRLTAIAAAVMLIVVGLVIATIGKDGVLSAFTPSSNAGESSTPPTTDAPSPQPKPPVPDTALDGLLLTTDEVYAATGWPTAPVVTPGETFDELNPERKFGGGCQSPNDVAASLGFRFYNPTAVRWQWTSAAPTAESRDWDWFFTDGVVAFSTAAKAADKVDTARRVWQDCADETVKVRGYTEAGGTTDFYWSLGSLSIDDGVLFMPKIQEGREGWMCWRALGARNNIAIDLSVCADTVTKADAQNAYNAIAAKVDNA